MLLINTSVFPFVSIVGEKPFKCDHCEYSTAQNSTLKIHLKRHHSGSVSLDCSHCGKQFPGETQLLWHKQEHRAILGMEPPATAAVFKPESQ